ncbi:sulfotransferase [Poseidonocella sp. HB161398]|uniref:sulfotransferase n=1 Tax=Poseidonocella sp. HB161398 TaxID=2320855 RepID=UPI0014875803|nr:sulfotransferase [Poseidonocella sp. HB161398]
MFQDELCRHGSVQTVPYSPHTYLETHWWLMAAVLLERPGALFAGGKPYEGYGSRRNTRAYMIDLLEHCAPGYVPPEENEALVFGGWEAICEALARPVFFEKSPQLLAHWAALSLLLEWMERTRFEVKIIGLVRNPHGVMYSASKLFGTDPASRQFAWANGCRNLLALEAMLPAGSYLRLRYEDLLPDPVESFAGVARFLGLAPDPAAGSGTRGGSTEKWVRDSEYRLGLDASVRQIAMQFGYGAAELDLPRSASAGRAAPAPDLRRRLRIWLNRRRDRFLQPMMLRARAAFRNGR